MSEIRSGSVLSADLGNVTTRVVLIDLVDGRYRLVAAGQSRTTIKNPIDDVNVGLHRAIDQISEYTGRVFIGTDGEIITPETDERAGVDYFLATGSAGRPMRAVIVGLSPDFSVSSALRALSTAYVDAVAAIHLEDGRNEEERLNTILLNRPDLIFFVGGTEGGAETALINLAKLVVLAVELINRSNRPIILYAGNSQLAEVVRDLIGDTTEVLIARNVRPSIEEEDFTTVQLQLGRAYNRFEASRGSGFAQLTSMSATNVLPTAQSYAIVTQYLAQTLKTNVLTLDIGSAVTTLSGVINGKSHTIVRTDIGVGHSAADLVDAIGVTAIKEFLPFAATSAEIRNYAMNKTLRPATVPMNIRDMYLEHGLWRAGARHVLKQARRHWQLSDGFRPAIGLIIGAGATVTNVGVPALSMLLLIDALQPTGITNVKLDSLGLVSALGALAQINPEAVVQILDSNDLEHLGTVISVSGQPETDKPALLLKITTEEGEVYEHAVLGGHLWNLPLPEGHSLSIEIRTPRGLSIGGKQRIKMTLQGGTAGIIFDARGRDIPIAATARERAAQLPLWTHEVTGDPPAEIPERWLVETETTAPSAEEAPKRRGLFSRRRAPTDGEKIRPVDMSARPVEDDDDFMRLLSQEDEKDETPEEDDLGALRNVLS